MTHYYIEKDGKVVGPMSLRELKARGIVLNTLIWRIGLKDWSFAKELQELKPILFPGPPPLPPSIIEKIYLENPPAKKPQAIKFEKQKNPKYDERYHKEREAAITGVFMFLVPIFFVLFYRLLNSYSYETFFYFKVLCFSVALIFRAIAVSWGVIIARHQNRDSQIWGFFCFLFPAICLMILGLRKKLYDSTEWKKYLYQEQIHHKPKRSFSIHLLHRP